MKDFETQSKNLKHFTKLLDELNIPYNIVEKYLKDQKFPQIQMQYNFEKYTFDVNIIAFHDFATVDCFLYDLRQTNEKMACQIFKKCLELNFSLPETTFSVFDNNIYIEADVELDVSKDQFVFELNGMVLGINEFVKYMETQNLKVSYIT